MQALWSQSNRQAEDPPSCVLEGARNVLNLHAPPGLPHVPKAKNEPRLQQIQLAEMVQLPSPAHEAQNEPQLQQIQAEEMVQLPSPGGKAKKLFQIQNKPLRKRTQAEGKETRLQLHFPRRKEEEEKKEPLLQHIHAKEIMLRSYGIRHPFLW